MHMEQFEEQAVMASAHHKLGSWNAMYKTGSIYLSRGNVLITSWSTTDQCHKLSKLSKTYVEGCLLITYHLAESL